MSARTVGVPGRHAATLVLCAILALAGTAALVAQQPARPGSGPAAEGEDADFAAKVREWTTRPEFLSPLVDHLPRAAGVPAPKDVLGYHIGEPKRLTYYADILKYYRALAAASPRVKVTRVGATDEGRETVAVFVGSEQAIADLETYRSYLAQLADPRPLTDGQALEIVAKAKPIYHLIGGLHSGETGPPEMLMELVYRLAVEDSPLVRQIRDHVIVSVTPVAEPDGRDRYVDWYYAYKTGETGEGPSFGGPPYWGKYILHDNNRDVNFSQVTLRPILDWYLRWHPPIIHELHESVPFLYTFSGQAPQNPTLDPILYGELPWFSNFEMAQMTKYGMPGVWTHAFVDMWYPGYFGFMASNHNGMLRMYETFGNGGANTMKRKIGGGAEGGMGAGGGQTTREWYRPLPPYPEVEWSIRNNINYMQTGVLSALQLTSAFPRVILENFYRKSRNSIEAGKKDAPFGYVIPAGQRDATRVAWVVNLLRMQGIEVGRATAPVTLKEGTFPAGSFVVKRDQPYGRLAKILLEKQVFPDPSLRTYDDTGWTMGLMTQTEVRESADKALLDVPVEPVDTVRSAGTMAGTSGRVLAVAHFGSANMITLRMRLKGVRVQAAEAAFKAGEVEYPAGSFLIDAGDPAVLTSARTAVESLGLTAALLPDLPKVATHEADPPRLAVFSTWGNTQDVGWVRHAFDRFEVPYDLIFKEQVKAGGLRAKYDVIVVPSQGRTGKGLVFDIAPGPKPLAYKKTDRFRHLGMYGESDDITGGMGLAGAAELQRFVEDGGVLVTMGAASFFPAEYGLARRVDAARPSAQFYAPGPIVEAEVVKPSHPMFYGYAGKTMPVRYANGPILRLPEQDREAQVLFRFTGGDRGVLSGLMRNPNEIRQVPAVLDVPAGRGRVVIFATNPCFRYQNLGEFNLLFNTLMHYND